MAPKLQCDTHTTEDPGQETNTWLKIIEHLFLQTHVFLIYPPDDNYRQFYFLKNFRCHKNHVKMHTCLYYSFLSNAL